MRACAVSGGQIVRFLVSTQKRARSARENRGAPPRRRGAPRGGYPRPGRGRGAGTRGARVERKALGSLSVLPPTALSGLWSRPAPPRGDPVPAPTPDVARSVSQWPQVAREARPSSTPRESVSSAWASIVRGRRPQVGLPRPERQGARHGPESTPRTATPSTRVFPIGFPLHGRSRMSEVKLPSVNSIRRGVSTLVF